MKKNSIYFLGECIIILLLLVVIGALLKDQGNTVSGKELNSEENEIVVVEEKNGSEETAEKYDGIVSVNSLVQERKDAQTVTENTQQAQNVSGQETGNQEALLDIVVFGDSIWNAGRGSDGISEQIMSQAKVKIYNCAIGGTTAAVVSESTEFDSWTSKSFNGMMYVANDAIDADSLIADDMACDVIKEVDFSTIDYVIVSYGLNDYFSDVPVYPKEYYDLTSYVGALRHGIAKLREEYPNLEVILASPTYCGWFEGEREYKLGTYVEAARSVAAELDVHFLDMYHALGKNPEQKAQYLEDGVHLTEEGRALYAHSVISFLNELDEKND